MRWKHVIFDLYGTLVDIRTDEGDPVLWERTAELYRSHGAAWDPEDLKEEWFHTARNLENQLCRTTGLTYPEIAIEEVFGHLYRKRGVEPTERLIEDTGWQFRQMSTHLLCLYEGARELLIRLRSSGRKVWLLTNAQRIFTRPELNVLGITDAFDGIYISSECGCKKPDSAFYRRLLKEQNIAPEEAIMVGNDTRCDILGAKEVGLSTMYIRSAISPKESLPQADCVLPRMNLNAAAEILLNK